MKKTVLSLILFAGVFSIIFYHLNEVFASKSHYNNTISQFKEASSSMPIDVILYGSSHAYTAYNPLILNYECEILSYNLGSDALRLCLTDLVFKESLKYTKPKLAIIEIYEGSLSYPETDRAKGYQLRALDFIPNYSFQKFEEVSRIYDFKEYLGVYFPLIRNHKKWNEQNYVDYEKTLNLKDEKSFFYNGFVGSTKQINNDKQLEKFKGFKVKSTEMKSDLPLLSKESKKEIVDFVQVARENNVDVLVVSSPDLRARYSDYKLFVELNEFCNSLNIPFFNLNDFYSEIGLEMSDFKDPGHLNTYGSIKATKFLAKYLKENYKFENRKNEPYWEKSMLRYDRFREIYDSKNNFERFNFKISKSLNSQIILEEMTLIATKEGYKFNFRFNSEQTDLNELQKYRVATLIFPTEKAKASLNSKGREKGYEAFNILPSKGSYEQILQVKTKIEEIDKIKVYLYDKDKYDGVKGKALWVNEIMK